MNKFLNDLIFAWSKNSMTQMQHNPNKVEKILKGCLVLISSPSPSKTIWIMGGKICMRCKGKTLLGVVNKLWKQKVCWHYPAMFCLINSSKLSCKLFEFSLKVMRLNPGYLLKSFLLYQIKARNPVMQCCVSIWYHWMRNHFRLSWYVTWQDCYSNLIT